MVCNYSYGLVIATLDLPGAVFLRSISSAGLGLFGNDSKKMNNSKNDNDSMDNNNSVLWIQGILGSVCVSANRLRRTRLI